MQSTKHKDRNAINYACEFKFFVINELSNMRTVISCFVDTFGMARYVDRLFLSDIRHADCDVGNALEINNCDVALMHKVDGMKMYMMCYSCGYVITLANLDLTVLSYAIFETTSDPDILVAEMMADGNLVYINTLSKNGTVTTEPYY